MSPLPTSHASGSPAGDANRDDIVRFDRVGVRFGDQTVFEDISFSIRAGEFLCLLGPSG